MFFYFSLKFFLDNIFFAKKFFSSKFFWQKIVLTTNFFFKISFGKHFFAKFFFGNFFFLFDEFFFSAKFFFLAKGSETLPEKETQIQGEGKKLETNKLFNKEGGAGHVRDKGGEEGGHEAGLGDPIGRRAPNTKNINWLSRLGEVRKKKA